jgi:hypothetical protein
MRILPVLICCCVTGVPVIAPAAIPNASPSDVTVVVNFKGARSARSVLEMQREADRILKSTGVRLNWVVAGADPHANYNDLVVLTFRGSCEPEPESPRGDDPGPYGITHISNGKVLPFAEVDCDRVLNAVLPLMQGEDYLTAERLTGRALGRVAAHELVHMLTRSVSHASEGVEEPALSGKQLLDATLPLSAMDIKSLQGKPAEY